MGLVPLVKDTTWDPRVSCRSARASALAPPPNPLLAGAGPGEQQGVAQVYLSPCHACERPGLSFQLLASTWPSPDRCGPLESGPAHGRSPCLFAFQINK